MEIPNRPDHDAAFARKLSRLSSRHRRELIALLGHPPDISRVPADFWERVRKERENELAAVLLLLFSESYRHHVLSLGQAMTPRLTDVGQAAAERYAVERAAKLAAESTAAVRDRIQRFAVEEWNRAGLDAQRAVTRTQVLNDVLKAIGPSGDAARAVTETTAAQTAGGETAATNTVGTSDDDVWQIHPELSETGTCQTCRPLDGRRRAIWATLFPNGPPAHRNCNCEIVYANVRAGLAAIVQESTGDGDGGEGRWITINGNHVKVGDDGVILNGPMKGTRLDAKTGTDQAASQSDGTGGKKRSGREEIRAEIAGKADEIRVNEVDRIPSEVDENDYVSIEQEMSREEAKAFENHLDALEDEYIENMVDEYDPTDDVDDESVHSDAGWASDDINDKWNSILDDYEISEDSPLRGVTTNESGIEGIAELHSDLPGDHEQYHELKSELESLEQAAAEEIEVSRENALDNARDDYRDNVRSNNSFDRDAESESYLDQFYSDNPGRFSGIQDREWYCAKNDSAKFCFTTQGGNSYKAEVFSQKFGDLRVPTFIFSDSDGSFDVTGAGEAVSVFSEVVPAAVSYLEAKQPDVMHFSAAEPSRRKLYNRLVKTTAAVTPDYAAAYYEDSHARHYFVYKKDMKDAVKQHFEKMGLEATALAESQQSPQPIRLVRLLPEISPEWFTEEGWQDDKPHEAPISDQSRSQ